MEALRKPKTRPWEMGYWRCADRGKSLRTPGKTKSDRRIKVKGLLDEGQTKHSQRDYITFIMTDATYKPDGELSFRGEEVLNKASCGGEKMLSKREGKE